MHRTLRLVFCGPFNIGGELCQAKALVPVGGSLVATGVRPTPLDEERDPKFAHDVWTRISAGTKPEEAEVELRVDSFRVYRLIAHWIDEGALRPTAG